MKFLKQNLGIDVDSEKLKVSLQRMDLDQNVKIKGSRTFNNTPSGFKDLLIWLKKNRLLDLDVHVTMEATGVYYENLAYFFDEQESYIVHVLLPNKALNYKKSLNSKSKTDEIDAKVLGQMGLERKLAIWSPGSTQMRTIKKFNRERLRLQREKVMVSNQLHAESRSHLPNIDCTERYNKRIEFINQQLEEINQAIVKQVKRDPELQQRIDNVTTAPGIGFITAIGLAAEMDGFALIKNRKQLVSYSGYDVVQNESGKSVGKTRISKKGNSFIRHMMHMPAMSAATHNEQYKKHYKRVKDTSKIPMKANVAIQRKLLLLAYTLYKNNTAFDPLYQQKVEDQLAVERNQKKQIEQQQQINRLSELLDKTADRVQATACSG